MISSPETSKIVDVTEPAFLMGSPPPPVEVAFVFWNCVEGTTPGNALRSWAGAHTGPISGRHGLFVFTRLFKTRGKYLSIFVIYPRRMRCLPLII